MLLCGGGDWAGKGWGLGGKRVGIRQEKGGDWAGKGWGKRVGIRWKKGGDWAGKGWEPGYYYAMLINLHVFI